MLCLYNEHVSVSMLKCLRFHDLPNNAISLLEALNTRSYIIHLARYIATRYSRRPRDSERRFRRCRGWASELTRSGVPALSSHATWLEEVDIVSEARRNGGWEEG
jgi:hypothetical protein